MRELNLRAKQQGVFSIELAIVAVFFSLLLVFSGDVIIKLSVKGKLDRLSYSLVSIIKERKQLYANTTTAITQTQTDDIYNIAKNSLKRTMGSFNENNLSILVEQQSYTTVKTNNQTTYQANNLLTFKKGTPDCVVQPTLDKLAGSTKLAVVSVQDRKLPLYRVTLCYETNNWIGSKLGTTFATVSSSSVMVGRL